MCQIEYLLLFTHHYHEDAIVIYDSELNSVLYCYLYHITSFVIKNDWLKSIAYIGCMTHTRVQYNLRAFICVAHAAHCTHAQCGMAKSEREPLKIIIAVQGNLLSTLTFDLRITVAWCSV